jgi:hypothetical protein
MERKSFWRERLKKIIINSLALISILIDVLSAHLAHYVNRFCAI